MYRVSQITNRCTELLFRTQNISSYHPLCGKGQWKSRKFRWSEAFCIESELCENDQEETTVKNVATYNFGHGPILLMSSILRIDQE